MVRVAAVVVLYHPDLVLLRRLLQSLAGQPAVLLVVDNSPLPEAALAGVLNSYQGAMRYYPMGENTGIAAAHNFGIAKAIEGGASHVLLLDQDSALPPRMVAALLDAERALLTAGNRVAAVGPAFIEHKTGKRSTAVRHRHLRVRRPPCGNTDAAPMETDYLIASGCLIRVSVLLQLGFMEDDLFIDWVDIEWGLRARDQGWTSYIVPQALMSHSIGDASVRPLGRDINLHTDTRNYYIVRNATYLLRRRSMGWSWRLITLVKIPQYILFYSWHSARRAASVALLCRAFTDGLLGKLGRMA